MEKFKKIAIPTLVILAVLAINFVICILLHVYFMAVIEDPFTIEGLTEVFEDQADSTVLDTYEDGDSALVLVQKSDGNVFLLEFHRNLLLNRYQILDVVHILPEIQEEHLPIGTVLRSYSVKIQDHKSLTPETADSHKLNFSNFFLLYGMNTLLLFAVEVIIWKTGKNFRKSQK